MCLQVVSPNVCCFVLGTYACPPFMYTYTDTCVKLKLTAVRQQGRRAIPRACPPLSFSHTFLKASRAGRCASPKQSPPSPPCTHAVQEPCQRRRQTARDAAPQTCVRIGYTSRDVSVGVGVSVSVVTEVLNSKRVKKKEAMRIE